MPSFGESSALLPSATTSSRRHLITRSALILTALCVLSVVALSYVTESDSETVVLRGPGATNTKRELDAVFKLLRADQTEDQADNKNSAKEEEAELLKSVAEKASADSAKAASAQKQQSKQISAEESAIAALMKSARLATKELILGDEQAQQQGSALDKQMAQVPQQIASVRKQAAVMSKMSHGTLLDDAAAAGSASAAAAGSASAPVAPAGGDVGTTAAASGAASGGSVATTAAAGGSGGNEASQPPTTPSPKPHTHSDEDVCEQCRKQHEEEDEDAGPPLFLFHGMWALVFFLCMLVGAIIAVRVTRNM